MALTKATQNVIEPFTQPTTFVVNSSSDAVRITQTGTGKSLTVEDSTNPDSTPFVVDTNGSVGIGTSSPTTKLHVESTGYSGARALFKSSDSGNYITVQGTDAAGINDSAFISFEDGNVANGAFVGITGQNQGQSGDFRIFTGGNVGGERMRITKQGIIRMILPTYATNAAAITGGLVANDMYKTATGELRIVV